MTIHNDFFDAIDAVIRDDNDFNDAIPAMVDAIGSATSTMNDIEQMMFAAGQFFLREAITVDEPRLFHAAFACLALTGVLEVTIGRTPGPGVLMDMADQCWKDARQVADQAIARLVWGAEES